MNESVILMNPADTLPFLSGLYAWGIAVIRNIQVIKNPAITFLMKAISSMGTEYFHIVIVLLIYCCADEKRGFRLGLIVIISGWINMTLKSLFGQPRPFNFDPAIGLAYEPSAGFPSGHAQMSATFWIAAAFLFAKGKIKKPLWIVSFAFILLIGFSRLYLGVHFPTDVFGGWIAACIILGSFYFIEKPASPFFVKTGKRLQLIIAAVAAILMNALHRQDTSLSGMFLGFCAGYSLMINHFPFTASIKHNGQKFFTTLLARSALALAGFFIIYFGFRFILPGKDSLYSGVNFLVPYYELSRFIRYGLMGLWASAGIPWLLIKTGLADSVKTAEKSDR